MPTRTLEQQPILTHYRFSVADYHRMADLHILPQGARVELLDGEIVEMTPAKSKHASMVDRLAERLILQLQGRATVKIQNPIFLDKFSEPEPDLVIARRRDDFYENEHPKAEDILFLIEVSDTSLAKDRQVKLPLYARAGIPEVWIIDLDGERVEVYSEPAAAGYGKVKAFEKGEEVAGGMGLRVMVFG